MPTSEILIALNATVSTVPDTQQACVTTKEDVVTLVDTRVAELQAQIDSLGTQLAPDTPDTIVWQTGTSLRQKVTAIEATVNGNAANIVTLQGQFAAIVIPPPVTTLPSDAITHGVSNVNAALNSNQSLLDNHEARLVVLEAPTSAADNARWTLHLGAAGAVHWLSVNNANTSTISRLRVLVLQDSGTPLVNATLRVERFTVDGNGNLVAGSVTAVPLPVPPLATTPVAQYLVEYGVEMNLTQLTRFKLQADSGLGEAFITVSGNLKTGA